jgi:UDP-N-acetyl-D-galactosamine dehydrogenase
LTTVAVVGLGYVGLPLAVEFGKKWRTIGFDLSPEKVANYKNFTDPTGEVSAEELKASQNLEPVCESSALRDADFIVVRSYAVDARITRFGALIGPPFRRPEPEKGRTVVFESRFIRAQPRKSAVRSSSGNLA